MRSLRPGAFVVVEMVMLCCVLCGACEAAYHAIVGYIPPGESEHEAQCLTEIVGVRQSNAGSDMERT